MNKLIVILFTYLLLGLYIDIRLPSFDTNRNYQTWCNGDYKQATINVSTIVPFRPSRETFRLGVGNKHFDQTKWLNSSCSDWNREDGDYVYEITSGTNGCENSESRMPTYNHFIDLAFLRKPVQDPTLYYIESKKVSQETYEKIKVEWEKLDGQACGR